MLWTSGMWTVKPGHEDEFLAAWREFAAWSADAFSGAHAWLLRDRDHANVFLSVGPWPTSEAVTAWRGSPGFGDRVGRIRALLEAFEPRTLDEIVSVS